MLVNELLLRMKPMARFATVSGQVNNLSSPEKLYRKCGFVITKLEKDYDGTTVTRYLCKWEK